jgi:GDPmannose 4,6-dehydratase
MKKALIIGISGQDGSLLAELLLREGYEVTGTSRDHEVGNFWRLEELGIRERVKLTSAVTSDFRSVLTALQQAAPDEVYNLAGQTSVGMSFLYPVETFDSILIGTMNILECLRLLGKSARLYSAGSSECFGNTNGPANEETPFRPRSPYATAKAAAHYAVANYREAYGLFACSGILFNHESPLRPARFVTQKIVSAASRIAAGSSERLSLGNLKVRRDWGWAPEYVRAMWLMLQRDKPDDLVVATGEEHSLQEFVERAFGILDLDWRDHVDVDESLFRPSDIEHSYGDASKALTEIGWEAETHFPGVVEKLVAAARSKLA